VHDPADRRTGQARALARLLDTAVRVPGTSFRIGLDPLLGLVPGIGDLVGGALSAYVLLLAARAGASKAVLLRMLANVGVDALVGTVPLVGDLFDAGYKANARNVALLERHLERPRETARASGAFVALLVVAALLLVAGGVTAAVLLLRWVLGQAG
jgi:hypothetical protein